MIVQEISVILVKSLIKQIQITMWSNTLDFSGITLLIMAKLKSLQLHHQKRVVQLWKIQNAVEHISCWDHFESLMLT